MKRLLSRMGLLGVLVMTTVVGQVFFASPAYAAENPSFDWEESYTADNKLGEKQLTWCSANLDGETIADLSNFRSGTAGSYVNDCLNKSVGGICSTVERGADEEYRCIRSIPDDHPLVLAIKAAEKNEVGPLQNLYCGTPNLANAGEPALVSCQQAVSAAYFSPKCFYANQKDSTAGRSSATDAASCVRDALRNNNKIINKNRTQAQVVSAIREGRKAANAKIQAAIKIDQNRLQCIEDKGTWENGACVNDNEGSGGIDEPVCSAGALGWIICPLSEGLVEIIQQVAELLQGLLIFQPLIGSDQGKAIKAIWNLILVLANTGLVIAILIIVFSQATSVGLSTYGIKKLLPRVFAAAILMNLSFYLCAIAVDLSNIFGVSVKTIVEAGMNQLSDLNAAGNSGVEYGAGIDQYFTVGVVGLVAAAIAIGTGAIWLLLPVLVTAALAIFTALLILAARQVLITLLIIIAPLAILAWILPNTDEWFTKWRKLFTILLLLFPIIMAVFYGSILVSAVMLSAGGNSGSGLNDFTIKLLAFLVLIVPLFSLPVIIKAAGGILDRFGVLVNNRNKGFVDRTRKYADERKGRNPYQQFKPIRKQAKDDLRRQRTAARLARSYDPDQKSSVLDNFRRVQAGGVAEAGKMAGESADKVATKGVAGLYRVNPALGDLGAQAVVGAKKITPNIPGGEMRTTQRQAILRSASAQVDKAFEQAVSDAATTQKNLSSDTFDSMAQGKVGGVSDAEQVAAARWVMSNGNFKQRKELYESISGSSSAHLRQTVSQQFYAKGDNGIIGSSFGGAILEGTSGGVEGVRLSTASNINARKVTPQSMVHDADATELLLGVASNASAYGISADGIASLKASADEAVRNESTRTKATAGIYNDPITRISRL